MRRLGLLLMVSLLGLAMSPGAVYAQAPDSAQASSASTGQGKGTATLTDWPASLSQLLREMGEDAPYLLPRIDSLALEYRYAANDTSSQWSFVFGWAPAQRVLYQGDVMPREKGPSDVRMVNVELRAEVKADGETVGEMIVAVDSMALRPFPSIYSFEVSVNHDRVFLDASAEEARRALERGVTLDNLVVERMGFTSAETVSTSERRRSPEARDRRAPRPEPSIYAPRTRIYVGWRVAPRPYYVGDRGGTRTVEPRGETVGRGAETGTTRAARRSEEDEAEPRTDDRRTRSKSDDEEEDEDDEDFTNLRKAALGAVAAVGLFAYVGGTVGVYGRGDTPIGLAAGYTRPSGGVQLQAAVNGAVLEGDSGQKLTLKALGFYDVFSSPVQPAVGLGVQIDPTRSRDVVPSASVGLAGNFGRFLLFGGADLVHGTPEVGVAYNFRYGAGDASDETSR